jgi:hypothetical protein
MSMVNYDSTMTYRTSTSDAPVPLIPWSHFVPSFDPQDSLFLHPHNRNQFRLMYGKRTPFGVAGAILTTWGPVQTQIQPLWYGITRGHGMLSLLIYERRHSFPIVGRNLGASNDCTPVWINLSTSVCLLETQFHFPQDHSSRADFYSNMCSHDELFLRLW